jgi:hypothetical protein
LRAVAKHSENGSLQGSGTAFHCHRLSGTHNDSARRRLDPLDIRQGTLLIGRRLGGPRVGGGAL